jgi:hypothetical protein
MKFGTLAPLWLLSALAAATSCGGGGSTGATLASGTVGPAGGMVQGGGVTVKVPAGALTADTTITVEKLEGSLTAPQPGLTALASYRLGPDRTTFSKPVVLAFAVDPAKLPAEATASGNALVLVHAGNDGSNPQIAGTWVGGESSIAGLATSFSLFEVAVLSTAGVGACPVAADVKCATELACDDKGVCGGACNVVVGAAGHELVCTSGGASNVTCTCHGPTATANDAFLLPPFLGPNPPVRLVWEYLRHCDVPCPDAGTDGPTTD